ncbi:response regulator transcription factor [Sphingomonas sp. MG17]|uniref:Response regulator transcription factor n=1 Tax=Sphingomonas tagetis TaxID=2949092 RepID=A0A9X2HJD8_9SPHN|nr:response regulator transcription factor [Sphingomonas tagetis]MCP3729951.1 response regulator transcription factor [Sphingomonas tagetis]
MRALVVEDDPVIGADVAAGLGQAGFVAELIADGQSAWFSGDTEDYAVVVLDLGLPGLDGLTVLRRWRSAGRSFPVLILSARADWTEKVEGIEAGADDYLAKPFHMGELVTRVRALLRRAGGRAEPVFELGRLRIDTNRMRIAAGGAEVRTSPLEFRLVNFLAHHTGRYMRTDEIAEHLYGTADLNDANAIETLVMRLRRKIGADAIETRRGFGYQLTGGAAA